MGSFSAYEHPDANQKKKGPHPKLIVTTCAAKSSSIKAQPHYFRQDFLESIFLLLSHSNFDIDEVRPGLVLEIIASITFI